MAAFLGLMTVLTFVQVILRYVFNTSLVWSLEATVYSFAWLVLIGMAYGVRTGGHIAAQILVSRFEGPARQAFGYIATALCLLYAGAMFYGSMAFFLQLMDLGHKAQDIPLPRWLLTLILPIGFGLLFYRLLEVAWKIYKGERLGPAGAEMDAVSAELDLVATSETKGERP